MFLILVAVGAGLCSAQTAGKKYYLVGGLFFEGMPPGVGSDNVAAFIIHEDGARHEVTELRLRKGFSGIQSERHRRTGVEQGRCDGTSYGLELLVYRLWSLYP